MAKLTIEQKISKIEDVISKEEKTIEASKIKIKNLQTEIKKLKNEKDKQFADELLKIIRAKGIDSSQLMNDLKSVPKKDNENSEPLLENKTFNSTSYSYQKNKK